METQYCLINSGFEFRLKIKFYQCLEVYSWNIEIYQIEEVDGLKVEEDFPITLSYRDDVFTDCWDNVITDNLFLEGYGLTKESLITLCTLVGTFKTPNYKRFNPYCEFTQEGENKCSLKVITDRYNPEAVILKLDELNIKYKSPVKEAWISLREEVYAYGIRIEPSISNYKTCSELWPNANWPDTFKVPKPNEESFLIQDKILWRMIVRPLLNITSTPAYLYREHLSLLREAQTFIKHGEFDRIAYQQGNTIVSSYNGKDLLPSLTRTISKIERLGQCTIID